jgi:hypothetical protein
MTDSNDKLQEFLNRANRELDDSVNKLDVDTQRALRLARGRAIDSLQKRRHFWQPAGAVALASVVAAVVISLHFNGQDIAGKPDAIEDIQLLSASEELEFYEDLEFYQWLELQERFGEG